MAAGKKERPIIIKKIVDGGHHGHHGGAWKVAYADFVTAMMAFFLLLWILNSVQEETLEGIADYFTPTMVPQAGLGGSGLMGGETLGEKGTLNSSNSPMLTIAVPDVGMDDPGKMEEVTEVATEEPRDSQVSVVVEYEAVSATTDQSAIDAVMQELQEDLKAQNDQAFDEIQATINQAMQSIPDLDPLIPNVIFEPTPEGLRIQIVDQDGQDMFPSGSSKMYEKTKKLVTLVGEAIATLSNELVITGHTDAVPFTKDDGYGNWELSSDRANATRRTLLSAGVDVSRVQRVSGVADNHPLIVDDPKHPSNRRISIVLMYEKVKSPSDIDVNITKRENINIINKEKDDVNSSNDKDINQIQSGNLSNNNDIDHNSSAGHENKNNSNVDVNLNKTDTKYDENVITLEELRKKNK